MRAAEADLWRAQQVQRAREEADLARQRFMQTHPDNRMVTDVLEAEWSAKLRALDDAQRELESSRAEPGQGLDDGQHQRILALAGDFPRLWNDPSTPHRERKRMGAAADRGRDPDQGHTEPGAAAAGRHHPTDRLDTGPPSFPAPQDQRRRRRRGRQADERAQL